MKIERSKAIVHEDVFSNLKRSKKKKVEILHYFICSGIFKMTKGK